MAITNSQITQDEKDSLDGVMQLFTHFFGSFEEPETDPIEEPETDPIEEDENTYSIDLTESELYELEYALVKSDTENPTIEKILYKLSEVEFPQEVESTITLPRKEVEALGMELEETLDSYTFYESEVVGCYISQEEFDRRKD